MVSLILTLSATAIAYSPPEGAKFNKPTGSRAEEYRILNHINASIRSSPPGSTVRIATYSINRNSTTEALVDAYRRGVNVQFIVDDHDITPQIRRLRQVLGRNPDRKSFAIVCKGGCRTQTRYGSLHAKMYLFSRAGSSKWVTMVSSANPTDLQAGVAWNNIYTIVGDEKIYQAMVAAFLQMSRDKMVRDTNRYISVRSGKITAYVFPRSGNTRATDNVIQTLNDIRCKGAEGSAGFKGRTVVKVTVFTWANPRGRAIARKLWELDDSGCYVSVIMASAGLPETRAIILKPTRNDGVTVYNSKIDSNGDGIKGDHWSHNKYLMISGSYAGNPKARYVLTGSPNYTRGALRNADEVMLGIYGRNTYRAYYKNFNDIIDSGSKLIS